MPVEAESIGCENTRPPSSGVNGIGRAAAATGSKVNEPPNATAATPTRIRPKALTAGTLSSTSGAAPRRDHPTERHTGERRAITSIAQLNHRFSFQCRLCSANDKHATSTTQTPHSPGDISTSSANIESEGNETHYAAGISDIYLQLHPANWPYRTAERRPGVDSMRNPTAITECGPRNNPCSTPPMTPDQSAYQQLSTQKDEPNRIGPRPAVTQIVTTTHHPSDTALLRDPQSTRAGGVMHTTVRVVRASCINFLQQRSLRCKGFGKRGLNRGDPHDRSPGDPHDQTTIPGYVRLRVT